MGLRVEMFTMFSDNYGFLLIDEATNKAALVDPGEAEACLRQVKKHQVDLEAIFNTHHHSDHAGGNREVLSTHPEIKVYAGHHDKGRIPGVTDLLEHGDRVTMGATEFEVLFVPGHTSGHIAYYTEGKLFCGDTLFSGGCGRLFEGTPEQMNNSLNEVLAALPDSTEVYCAHEYTINNLNFAQTLESNNPDLQQAIAESKKKLAEGNYTVPSTLGREKLFNPFMRTDSPEILKSLQSAFRGREFSSADRVFAAIRELKDRY